MTAATPHLLYIFDPMCSWCYGFAPVIGSIARHFGDRLPVKLMVGGLRAGNTRPMTDKDRDYIRGAWTRVGAASGQPFDFTFFDRDSFVYDTEPACRAIVTVRSMAPGQGAWPSSRRVSSAFYGHNRDTTSADVLADVAAEQGIDRDAVPRRVPCRPTSATRPSAIFCWRRTWASKAFPVSWSAPANSTPSSPTASGRSTASIEALEKWLAGQASA